MEAGKTLEQGNPSFKYSRIEFPRFNDDNLDGWVFRCEQFFEYEGTTEKKKVKIIAINLEGKALQWHRAMMAGRVGSGLPNLSDFLRGLFHRFGHTLYEDPMSGLINLKQTAMFKSSWISSMGC